MFFFTFFAYSVELLNYYYNNNNIIITTHLLNQLEQADLTDRLL